MEIRLLQNLAHANIVAYIDAIRSDDHLNIVLEYVENGSLSNMMAKLLKRGHVEEQLVAVYTSQILEGLRYLHEQGVIHRDIKGANILSTKEGVVKLADFGVATRLNDSRKSDSVVGTPYWSTLASLGLPRALRSLWPRALSGPRDHRDDGTAELCV